MMTRPDPRPSFPAALAVALASLVVLATAVAAQSSAPRSSTGPDTPRLEQPHDPWPARHGEWGHDRGAPGRAQRYPSRVLGACRRRCQRPAADGLLLERCRHLLRPGLGRRAVGPVAPWTSSSGPARCRASTPASTWRSCTRPSSSSTGSSSLAGTWSSDARLGLHRAARAAQRSSRSSISRRRVSPSMSTSSTPTMRAKSRMTSVGSPIESAV